MKFMDVLKQQREEAAPYMKVGFARKVQSFPGRVEKWVNTWPNSTSATDIIRCSGLYYMCPREFVLNYWRPEANNSFDFNSYLRMGVGTYLHSFLQDVILGISGVLYGNWASSDESTVRGFMPDPEKQLDAFVQQRPLPYKYVEDRVWDEHSRLRGHTDGIIDKARFEMFCELVKDGCEWQDILPKLGELKPLSSGTSLLEIKTTSSRLLGNINSQSDIAGYYQMQAVAYQKLKGIDNTVFWYFERNDLASKTIMHEYSDSWWQEIKQKINTVWTAIRDHTLPDSFMKCVSSTDSRARKCVHAETCWKPPLGSDSMEEFIATCKAAQPEREWLDLSSWEPL